MKVMNENARLRKERVLYVILEFFMRVSVRYLQDYFDHWDCDVEDSLEKQ